LDPKPSRSQPDAVTLRPQRPDLGIEETFLSLTQGLQKMINQETFEKLKSNLIIAHILIPCWEDLAHFVEGSRHCVKDLSDP